MTDAPDNLILEQLRLIRGDLADLKMGQDRLDIRMSALEVGMSSLETQMAAFSTVADSDRGEIARIKLRIERIERRLELSD